MNADLRRVAALVAIALLIAPAYSFAAERMPIVLEETSRNSPVGSRLAFAIRERIRGTAAFQLVQERSDALLRFSIVTLDDKSGHSTVYSTVFSAWQPETGTWTYLDNIVGTCGTNKIQECADGLVGDADSTSEQVKKFYRTYYKDKSR